MNQDLWQNEAYFDRRALPTIRCACTSVFFSAKNAKIHPVLGLCLTKPNKNKPTIERRRPSTCPKRYRSKKV